VNADRTDDPGTLDVLLWAVPVSSNRRQSRAITSINDDAYFLGHLPSVARINRGVNRPSVSLH